MKIVLDGFRAKYIIALWLRPNINSKQSIKGAIAKGDTMRDSMIVNEVAEMQQDEFIMDSRWRSEKVKGIPEGFRYEINGRFFESICDAAEYIVSDSYCNDIYDFVRHEVYGSVEIAGQDYDYYEILEKFGNVEYTAELIIQDMIEDIDVGKDCEILGLRVYCSKGVNHD